MKKNDGTIKNYIVLHLILFLYSLNGIFAKLASENRFLSSGFLVYYGLVLLNLVVYALLWQRILKRMPLNSAFSNRAIIVVWGMIWGALFFHERITTGMILGAATIFGGIYLIARDDAESSAKPSEGTSPVGQRRER